MRNQRERHAEDTHERAHEEGGKHSFLEEVDFFRCDEREKKESGGGGV